MSRSQNNHFKVISVISILLLIYFGYKLFDRITSSPNTKIDIAAENPDTDANFTNSVEQIVKQYITNNPEIIIESIEMMHRKKIGEMEAKIQAGIKEKLPEILASDNITLNNAQKDATIVMFYDYMCNYCKKSNEIVNKILKNDDKIEVVYIPIPLLGDFSDYLSKLTIALHRMQPEKFKTIHDEIMATSSLTKEKIQAIIESNGINFDDLEIEMSKPEVVERHNKVLSWISELRINGAPAFILNGNFYPGLLDQNTMQKLIAEDRISNQARTEISEESK